MEDKIGSAKKQPVLLNIVFIVALLDERNAHLPFSNDPLHAVVLSSPDQPSTIPIFRLQYMISVAIAISTALLV